MNMPDKYYRFKARWALQWMECRDKYLRALKEYLDVACIVIGVVTLVAFMGVLVFMMVAATGAMMSGLSPDQLGTHKVMCLKSGAKLWGCVLGAYMAIRYLPIVICTAWHLYKEKK